MSVLLPNSAVSLKCNERNSRLGHHLITVTARTTRTFRGHWLAFLLMVPFSSLRAQREGIPIRQLELPDAVSELGVVASVAALRALSSNVVFVNDVAARRVVLLDDQLRLKKIVADTSIETRRIYGGRATGLFAMTGDSTLFLNGSTLSVAVLDAQGNIARIMAAPRPSDFGRLVGGFAGNPGFDSRGRLVYRTASISLSEQIRLGEIGISPPESAAIVRFDFKTRQVDTAAYLRIYTPRIIMVSNKVVSAGGQSIASVPNPVVNPAPTVDDWGILSDGRIAVVRGRDYHVDFIDAQNAVVSSPNIPFAWRRLEHADKVALIDSTKALRNRAANGAEPNNKVVTTNGPQPQSSPLPPTPEATYVGPDELPDYLPVFATGGVRADADGNTWVRLISSTNPTPGAVYDVLDGRGRLIDRVRVPANTVIAGFAPNGAIFLARRDAAGLTLLRVRHRLPLRKQ